jgi:HPt (histidine-containing phosphotransfer) domain-containing protein
VSSAVGQNATSGGDAEPAGPVLDEAILAELGAQLGAADIEIFAAMFRSQAAGLIAVIEAGDPQLIAREAHSMASSAGTLGLSALMASCRVVMLAAREQPERIPALALGLKTAAERALAAMAARFPEPT